MNGDAFMKLKRIVSIILTIILTVSVFSLTFVTQSYAANTRSIKGDVNNDGKITAADARLALRAAAGLEILSADKTSVADMDSNGKITAADARTILRMAAGLDKTGTGNATTDFSKCCGVYYSDKNENGPCYGFNLISVDKNTNMAEIAIWYVGPNLSPVYETDLIKTKINNDGSASFTWKDSWFNEGTGTFKIKSGAEYSIDLEMIVTKKSDFNRATLATNGVLNLRVW